MRVRNETDGDKYLRDVHRVLSQEEVGIRWADQVSEVITFRYPPGTSSVDVLTTLKEKPLSAVVLSAWNRNTGRNESFARIEWTWLSGSIRVHSVDVTTPADDYDVTIGFVR